MDSIEVDLPTKEEVLTNSYRDNMKDITEHPPEEPSSDVFINPDFENM